MNRERILFVDDEVFFAKRYRAAIADAYDLVYTDSATVAYGFLREQGQSFAAVVLDVMMPPPVFLGEEATEAGYATGIWLLREAWTAQERVIPTVILTNRKLDAVVEAFRRFGLNADDPRVRVLLKGDTLARDLPVYVAEVIEAAQNVRDKGSY